MKTNCAFGRGGKWVSAGCWKSLRCVKWLHCLTADCPGNNAVDFSLVFNVCVVSSASCWQLLSMCGRLISRDFSPSPLWAALASPCFQYQTMSSQCGHHIFLMGSEGKGDGFPHKLLRSCCLQAANHVRYWFLLRYVSSQRFPRKLKNQHPFTNLKYKSLFLA